MNSPLENLAALDLARQIAGADRPSLDTLTAERDAYSVRRGEIESDRYARGAEDDSALSRWAESMTADKHNTAIELANVAWLTTEPALYQGERRVSAWRKEGSFGHYWHLADHEAKALGLAKPFVNDTRGARGAVTKAGLRVVFEIVPGKVDVVGQVGMSRAVVVTDTARRAAFRDALAGRPAPYIVAEHRSAADAVLCGIVAPEVARAHVDGDDTRIGLVEQEAHGSDQWRVEMIAAYRRGLDLGAK